jgi:hypothetical protein
MKKILIILFIMGVAGCASAPKPVIAKYKASFKPGFAFDATKKTDQDITLAYAPPRDSKVIIPKIVFKKGNPGVRPPYDMTGATPDRIEMNPRKEHSFASSFKKGLAKDLEDLIISKGYKILSIEEPPMTYPEKQQSTLYLMVDLDWEMEFPQLENKAIQTGGLVKVTKNTLVTEGECIMAGRLVYEIYEPMTQNKLFVKKVPLDEGVDCTAQGAEDIATTFDNSIGKLLEKVYAKSLKKADAYLDVNEVENLAKLGLELKEKATR